MTSETCRDCRAELPEGSQYIRDSYGDYGVRCLSCWRVAHLEKDCRKLANENLYLSQANQDRWKEITRLRAACFRTYQETGWCPVTDTHNDDLYVEWGLMEKDEEEE